MKRKPKQQPVIGVFAKRGITEGYIVVRAERWQSKADDNGGFPPHVYVSSSPVPAKHAGVGGNLYPTRELALTAAQKFVESGREPALIFKAVALVTLAPRPLLVTEIE
jgi:hypothetical protein